jgi:hypothetical protein
LSISKGTREAAMIRVLICKYRLKIRALCNT